MPLRSLAGRVKRRLTGTHLILGELDALRWKMADMERRLRYLQEGIGRVESRQLEQSGSTELQEREFRVFSQWGEDGIIQFLIENVPIERKVFVEFGVEGYQEANTRFLMVNNNWAGLVIDGDPRQVARIKQSPEYWLHNLKAVTAFVTRDNINEILIENGVTGEIGLLSIDIDGMDYWVWQAIDAIAPAIVVIEYNYRFGIEDAVTVPYRPDFDRWKAHHSILYYGASLKAMTELGKQKGYALVGVGSHGLNAFFVRRDLLPDALREVTAEEVFRIGQFDEAHDEYGNRFRMPFEEERRLVRSLPLVHVAGDVRTDQNRG